MLLTQVFVISFMKKNLGLWKSDSANEGFLAENVHNLKSMYLGRDAFIFSFLFIFEVCCTRTVELFLYMGVLRFSF